MLRFVHTLVVCKTFASRGRSLTPSSRMFMDESSSCMLFLSEPTHASRGDPMAEGTVSSTILYIRVALSVVASRGVVDGW